MSEALERLREELARRPSAELVSILRNRDEEEWRAEIFDIVAQVLEGRGISPEEVAAMGPEGYDVVEAEPTVTIAHFFSPPEAHASRMALEGAGIRAWVADEAAGTMYGVGIGARLQVRVTDETAARELLAAAPIPGVALPPEIAEPPCPACGSSNVAPEARVAEEASAETGAVGSRRKWYSVCADCHAAWPM
jgi:hypothetical protein